METYSYVLASVVAVSSLALLWLRLGRQFVRFVYLAHKMRGPTQWEFYTVHLKHLLSDRRLEYIYQMCQRYEYKPVGVWFLNQFAVVLSDVESIGDLYKSRAFADKPSLFYGHMATYIGRNLFTLNGTEYKNNRKLLSKPLRTAKVTPHLARINAIALKLVDGIRDVANGEEVDVRPIVSELAAAFAVSIYSSGTVPTEKLSPFVETIVYMSRDMFLRQSNPVLWLMNKLTRSSRVARSSVGEKTSRSRRAFLEGKCAALKRLIGKSADEADNVLEVLAMHPGQFDDEGFSETKAFLMGGYETTAYIINLSLLLIAMHPEVQERLYQEMESIFGESERLVELQDLSAMVFLEMTLKEATRLFPPVGFLFKRAETESTLNGTIVPEGANVLVNLYVMHRNPNVFQDPLKFNPERFSPERSQERHPFDWLTFSAGPRVCPGKTVAMMMLKTAVCQVIRNFEISLGPRLCTMEDIPVKTNAAMELGFSSLSFTRRRP